MDKKICIVTGASRGMGRGTALVLARDKGCRVYATARNAEALKQLAEEASDGSLGGEIIPFPLDHGKDDDIEQFVRSVSGDDLLRHDGEQLGEFFAQVVRIGIRIESQVAIAGRAYSLDDGRRRRIGVFICIEFYVAAVLWLFSGNITPHSGDVGSE